MKPKQFVVIGAFVLVAASVFWYAFTRTGIAGKVHIAPSPERASAKAVVAARVQIRQANAFVTTLHTDEQGEFAVRLEPGVYEINIDADGFLSASFSKQQVQRFHRLKLDVTLQPVAQRTASVTPPGIDTVSVFPKRRPNEIWRASQNTLTGTPHRVVGSTVRLAQAPQSKEQATTLSQDFLRRFIADNQKSNPNLVGIEAATLNAGQVRKFKDKWLVAFGQRAKNPFSEEQLPVFGSVANVTISGNEVVQFGLDLFPEIKVTASAPPMSKAEALATLARETNARQVDTANVQLVIFPIPRAGTPNRFEYVLAYHLNILTPASDPALPFEAWSYVIEASTGRTLFRENRGVAQLQSSGRVKATIYAKSPEESQAAAVAMNSGQIGNEKNGFQTLAVDGGFHIAGATLRELSVRPSDTHFSLFDSGPLDLLALSWFGFLPPHQLYHVPLAEDKAEISFSGGASEVTLRLDARPNTLHHLHRVRDFFITHGLADWLDTPLKVAFVQGYPNAFYSGANEQLVFGSLAEPLGLRSDVIYHEYTHGVVEWLVNRTGTPGPLPLPYQDEAGAMNEGLADYFACAINNDSEMRLAPPEHAIGKEHNRRLDNELRYDRDLKLGSKDYGYVHDNSRIFSGALWRLRNALIDKMGEAQGANYADGLVLEALLLRPTPQSFADFSINLLLADDNDNRLYTGTPNFAEIQAAFNLHALPLAPFELNRSTLQYFNFTSVPASPAGHIEEGRKVAATATLFESGYGLNLGAIIFELNGKRISPDSLILTGTPQRLKLRFDLSQSQPVRSKHYGAQLAAKLLVRDWAGNETVAEASKPLRDTIKPEYKLTNMARQGSNLAVTIRVTDFGSGVNPQSFIARLDGNNVAGIQQERVSDYEYLLSLTYPCDTQAHTLYAEVADYAGNVNSESMQAGGQNNSCFSPCAFASLGVIWAMAFMRARRREEENS